MHSPVEIDVRMDGSGMLLTKLANLAPITIQLAMVGYLPLTLTPIYDRTNPRLMTLRISYDYWPDVIEDLNILYLLAELLQENLYGDGSTTKE